MADIRTVLAGPDHREELFMRIPHPGARAGQAAIGVLLLAATFLAVLSGPAQGDPEVDPRSASQSNLKADLPGVTTLIEDNPAEGLPGFDDLPANLSLSGTEGTVTNSQHAVARRAKMSITTSPIWAALYTFTFNSPIENPTTYKGGCNKFNKTPCTPDPFYQPPCATDDPSTQWPTRYSHHILYPFKPLEGGGAEVGILSEDKLNLIAFGSIPATATLTMSVPRVNGKVQPLASHLWERRIPGAPTGCSPRPNDIPIVSALVEGKVTLELSDLEVDGVPVELGTKCRTSHPANIYLWGDYGSGSYFPATGGPLAAYEGMHPGSRGPLNDPYYYEDNGRTIPPSSGVDIPPFVNCGVGGEDLSPVVTAMASGPNNPVRAIQGPLIFINRIPLENITMCEPHRPTVCPLPAPEIPEMPPLPDGEGE
ncbi:hypothetical protein [Nocardioides albus]|uniref:Uncharacterized protein n=1 Tax=Nocardioides albus TaxID=1841 RepID=A0A7W5A7B4_9ACTN|nr:hypothetical protein [Nocardioides albus]MBB3091021.1 hypothetical protein [Nocardioides albus]GGU39079.1 hypothetical protein GCM10007979_42920 [Nocardioides albus]